jgi:NAD(P)H-dependent FMN reductase
MAKILAFAGSTRGNSFNKQLVAIAAEGARAAGASVKVIDLRDFPMPIFDEDDEAANGKSKGAIALKKLLMEHDGFLIACPEYNSSITAVLKNSIDWVSRPDDGDPPGGIAAFRGKVITLMSASPGALGGLRGLVHVRAILGNLGSIVLPDQVAVPAAYEAFNEDGSLADEKRQKAIHRLGHTLAETTAKLQA